MSTSPRCGLPLEEIGLPVAFHQAAGQVAIFENKMAPGAFWTTAVGNKISLGWVFMQLAYGAVPERHPNLRFVLVEGGIGWIAFQLNLMDHLYGDHRQWMEPKLQLKPSEYFWRQFWATFEDDRPGLLTLPMLDDRKLMWAGDYPHTEGNFPAAQEFVARDFDGIDEQVRRRIVHDNAIGLYGLESRRVDDRSCRQQHAVAGSGHREDPARPSGGSDGDHPAERLPAQRRGVDDHRTRAPGRWRLDRDVTRAGHDERPPGDLFGARVRGARGG